MHTFTFLQWIQAMWWSMKPYWILGIICWTVILADWTEKIIKKKYATRKIKGQEGQIIYPQKESLGEFQSIHKNKRLTPNHG